MINAPGLNCASTSPSSIENTVHLSGCRKCSGNFRYKHISGDDTEILVGKPPIGLTYKAVSHVWGSHFVVHMYCQSCSTTCQVRLRSKATFQNIMALAGPGSTIWVDAISIDQNDHSDIAAQVAVMGDIYGDAHFVSVLLPPSDMEAYETIAELLSMAKTILDRKWMFDYHLEETEMEFDELELIEETGKVAKQFYERIATFQSNMSGYQYWTRAWTFQEWARAKDVEIAYDGSKRSLPVLQRVKSTILFAGIMIADYKLRKGQYARMDVGWTRGWAKTRLEALKRLFPFEDVFASPNEVSRLEVRYQTAYPNEGTNAVLGLRDTPRKARTTEEKFRARLSLMLDSFAGMNARQATYEADLVCCWASMCNISYDYSKDDSLDVAIVKIVRALRQLNITIFNFTAGGQSEQDVDLAFLMYAASHRQSNATNDANFPDLPIFTGHADTLKHIESVLTIHQRQHKELPYAISGTATIQAVKGAAIITAGPLHNRPAVIGTFQRTLSGGGADYMFNDQMDHIWTYLNSIADSILEGLVLLIVAIPKPMDPEAGQYFYAWAICPRSVIQTSRALYVGRESLNGTLVIAKDQATSIVAYLTVSDQRSGTYLLPVSPDGLLDLALHTMSRSDMFGPNTSRNRKLCARLRLVDPSTVIADCGGSKMLWNSAKALRAFIRSNSDVSNDAAVVFTGEDEQLELLQMLVDSVKLPAERKFERSDWPGLGSTALDIDIGHPDLLPEGSDAANFQRTRARKLRHRASLDSQWPELNKKSGTSNFTLDVKYLRNRGQGSDSADADGS